jgi:carbonic anhydrase
MGQLQKSALQLSSVAPGWCPRGGGPARPFVQWLPAWFYRIARRRKGLSCSAIRGSTLGRRQLLGISTAAVTSALLVPRNALADALTAQQREKLSPEQILELMRKGNQRFAKGQRKNRDYLREQRASAAEGQHRAAVLLSCIDSRAPAEVIMDLGLGDVFNARVAGNVVNDDIAGSIEFATKLAGAKVILVMGHTACGAIKDAIDGAQLGNLSGLLAKIRPAVDATTYAGPVPARMPSSWTRWHERTSS